MADNTHVMFVAIAMGFPLPSADVKLYVMKDITWEELETILSFLVVTSDPNLVRNSGVSRKMNDSFPCMHVKPKALPCRGVRGYAPPPQFFFLKFSPSMMQFQQFWLVSWSFAKQKHHTSHPHTLTPSHPHPHTARRNPPATP